MLHGRTLVIAALIAVSFVGTVINAVGPFAPHPQLSYAAFLADFRAGKVGHISHWRDRLEVTETEALYVVVVPADRDLSLDLTAEYAATPVGFSYEGIPDDWLTSSTPWVAGLLALAGLALWLAAVLSRRVERPGSRIDGSTCHRETEVFGS